MKCNVILHSLWVFVRGAVSSLQTADLASPRSLCGSGAFNLLALSKE